MQAGPRRARPIASAAATLIPVFLLFFILTTRITLITSMSHVHLHEVYTACAHSRFFDTIPLGIGDYYSKYHPHHPHQHHHLLHHVEHDAVFRFGWCPNCLAHLSSALCRQGRTPINVRDVRVLRAYWLYKAANQMDAAVASSDIPYSAFDPAVAARLQPQLSHAFGESALLWEERALWHAVQDLRPKQVYLGPLLFRLPVIEDTLRNMLRGARQWTILWAKGDEALYKKDPGLDLNKPWHPADDEGWEIERFYRPYRPLPPGREKLREHLREHTH